MKPNLSPYATERLRKLTSVMATIAAIALTGYAITNRNHSAKSECSPSKTHDIALRTQRDVSCLKAEIEDWSQAHHTNRSLERFGQRYQRYIITLSDLVSSGTFTHVEMETEFPDDAVHQVSICEDDENPVFNPRNCGQIATLTVTDKPKLGINLERYRVLNGKPADLISDHVVEQGHDEGVNYGSVGDDFENFIFQLRELTIQAKQAP